MLESERERFATANAQGGSRASGSSKTAQVDEAKMDVEVSRIQGLITDISKLIDDPATEFSTAIRKNVERAEFDAYLKGILFSLGRGKGM
jgi:hypothetical protein